MKLIKYLFIYFNYLRFIPHIFIFLLSSEKQKIKGDIQCWAKRFLKNLPEHSNINSIKSLIWLLSFHKEYRNVFLYRIKKQYPLGYHLCNFLSPRLDSLYIPTVTIGKELFIEHGFSTIISAERIGDKVSIYQQVTIGYSDENKAPIIGNNVVIYPGAKVIGGITIGDNVIIGANAVVVKDVPPNCTVVGVPAYIIRRDGQKVNEAL